MKCGVIGMAKRLWSVFTEDMDRCIYTGSTTVERHHVFGGSNRNRSERFGYVAPLRPDYHPNGVFADKSIAQLIDTELKQRCQKHYEENHGTREQFIREFGKSYL